MELKLKNISVSYNAKRPDDPLDTYESLNLKATIDGERYYMQCIVSSPIEVEQAIEYINRMLSDMEAGKAFKCFEIRKRRILKHERR